MLRIKVTMSGADGYIVDTEGIPLEFSDDQEQALYDVCQYLMGYDEYSGLDKEALSIVHDSIPTRYRTAAHLSWAGTASFDDRGSPLDPNEYDVLLCSSCAYFVESGDESAFEFTPDTPPMPDENIVVGADLGYMQPATCHVCKFHGGIGAHGAWVKD